MSRIACLLACISSVGHARRVQNLGELLQHSALVERPNDPERAAGTHDSLKLCNVVEALLSKFSLPTAAFNPAAPRSRLAAGSPSHASSRRVFDRRDNVRGVVLASAGSAEPQVPASLAQAPFTAELEAVQNSGTTKEDRMEKVLVYLQEMLMSLDFAEGASGVEEDHFVEPENQQEYDKLMWEGGNYTDANFVDEGRPWLFLNEFHQVQGTGIVKQIWSLLSNATFLKEGEVGGGILFLMPEQLELPLLEKFADVFESAVVSEVNPTAEVKILHPELEDKRQRFPSPLLRVFVDTPELRRQTSDEETADLMDKL